MQQKNATQLQNATSIKQQAKLVITKDCEFLEQRKKQ